MGGLGARMGVENVADGLVEGDMRRAVYTLLYRGNGNYCIHRGVYEY